ncbi:23S rRNA (guanosine(2251)-2'-O)-methyltransferase RlmB [Marinicella sp. S1101]|uniref:23S rRNA (guanosine(2251)-2'-O)-methyltransferase RlmB n=1 Tax=Marinicella marina TaxID=2996016 RepID=UPI002260B94C|nr:23S rRNA (guanosine(2251)-2'-O)-methyltransferase RlmB [Marinicella marina]MCX7552748.1 23S rRNA (guanosine(2251)-2'-O)-methyltransferase RlmB [Marinicella marina]MDJ1139943.1 23S rRNA (guanosine(2251)-2'-O)-methyltransferase RlmB [Marinicella marina]
MTSENKLIFGIHAIEMAIKAGEVKTVWLQKDAQNKRLLKLLALVEKAGVTLNRLSLQELDRLCDERHQGVVASINAVQLKTEKELKLALQQWDNPLILILDCIEDPRNLGACLRSADAAGVTAVVFSKDKSASITPITHKTAAGAVEHLEIFQVTNLARAIEAIKAAGVWVYGTALSDDSVSIYDTKFSGAVAVVMGNEGKGLRHLVKQSCDHLVHIPMAGEVQSLNVSVATGVALFEVIRQRAK